MLIFPVFLVQSSRSAKLSATGGLAEILSMNVSFSPDFVLLLGGGAWSSAFFFFRAPAFGNGWEGGTGMMPPPCHLAGFSRRLITAFAGE